MVENLEGYAMALFGWAKEAMQHEMAAQNSLEQKLKSGYLTKTEITLMEDSGLLMIGIGILVVVEAFLLVVMLWLLFHTMVWLIRTVIFKLHMCFTKKKRLRQHEIERLIQKRNEAILLQYVLESEERTKGKPDALKLPEFMVKRERRNKHAY